MIHFAKSFFGVFCFALLLNSPVFSQAASTFELKITDDQPYSILNSYNQILEAKDSLQFRSLIQTELFALWSQGYLLARLDTIAKSSENKFKALITIGEQYKFGEVQISERDLAMVNAAGLKNVRWKDKFLSSSLVAEYSETLLTYLENNGYPFANIHLDSTIISSGIVNSTLKVSRNKYVPFDSLAIQGNVDIRSSYMSRYLNIKVDNPYDRSKINEIEKRINDLTFVELDSTPIIKFTNNKAQIQLFLRPKKASRFDFLIGVLPSTENGQRRFSIIGDFTGEMYNKLGQGEYIYANVQSRPETRILDVRFSYPYVLNLPLGIDLKGGIFFNEQFRETVWNAGILYQFDGGSSLKASWNNKTSRLIDVDTTSILLNKRLPNQLDIAYNGGGLEYVYRNLDYRFNPTRGWEATLSGTVGLKKIIRNNRIEELSRPEIDFNEAYDTLKLNTLQTEARLSAALYIPAFGVSTVKLGIEGGLQYNEEQIYENELYRIGGNALLRGFDELSVLTSTYLVNTFEFRLLLDRNSFLSFPFIDYGVTRVMIDEQEQWDTTFSVGMGINFSTPAGIFNVSFAAGRRLNNPLDFGNTKIHFGYVSLF
ncbi:MAG: BamA/TamA family outer membrane protein [Bacteroidota bacterium]